jgi:hypothetical protein
LVTQLGLWCLGHLFARRSKPFSECVARQAFALGNFAVKELRAQLHAPDLGFHSLGDHFLALLLKYSAAAQDLGGRRLFFQAKPKHQREQTKHILPIFIFLINIFVNFLINFNWI